MYTPGSRIELSYPESTLIDAVTRLRRRRIEVNHVRDLVCDPLTPEEFLRRPLIRRSRWLVTGIDLETMRVRQFYLGSSKQHRSSGILRVGLYAPGDRRPSWPFPLEFNESRRDRELLARAIETWSTRELGELSLRVYAHDFRIIRPPLIRSA
jgi:hypothetical protein